MSDEKTEQPTDKKLRDAREKGQVVKSTDVVQAACLAGAFLAIQSGSKYLSATLRAVVGAALDFVHGPRSMQDITVTLADMGKHCVILLCAMAAAPMVASLLALAAQAGLMISLEPIMPKIESVSPASGLMKIFSMNSIVELIKMTVKGAIVAVVMWQTIGAALPVVASALEQSVPEETTLLWSIVTHVVVVALGVFIVIAAFDYKLQHWMFIRKNRMSKDEIKREMKDSDGNPEVKNERKKRAREGANENKKENVGRANVVVVNPTHYAVALRYAPAEFPLPVVVAKGVDDQALLMRRYATEAGVPIVSNPPVARMLYKVPENRAIPEELFEVVVAILRWVDSLAAPEQRS
ncbi:EscU/YscU/HrcU family type III secretion system export apparatus switch protein [Paraburkholderia sp. NMBU_R16]|uniref:type III secretion system export apparatus subunit SctU n=1 Tax=Paraburkholderia sp. NMBU_R16 TaxID=2698676 RepID=UPI0015670BCE|nr:type III secretion system export apparatus subunit SctU [Paraburkholderia sp. NMBU_R16]NRO98872.1 EscU/YscU/HrcU family type III secretion system export apparatus switch protein [Paraburkholderia sp. NMBU_R16]